jgi:hypothetical protein
LFYIINLLLFSFWLSSYRVQLKPLLPEEPFPVLIHQLEPRATHLGSPMMTHITLKNLCSKYIYEENTGQVK